ncbi:RHS repeat-associated core domain-containing protein [Streptomyces sp. NPDC057271]|uniref:RHS repeat-associated core domain-containing protein n=1 Tax=unclassified Streptomyces TaxID=2593676 RepID=UPI003633ED0A
MVAAVVAALGAGVMPWTVSTAAAAYEEGSISPTMAAQGPPSESRPGGGEVDTKRGDFGYTFSFELPEGRMGFTPSLGLAYSSESAVHGGVAAGWELTVPAIRGDRRAGSQRLADAYSFLPEDPSHFVGPGGEELVSDATLPVSTGARGFRGIFDSSYAIYEFLGGVSAQDYWWRVRTNDGVTRYFGEKSQHPYTYAPLVLEESSYGDTTTYTYSTVGRGTSAPAAGEAREFRLDRIDYGNPEGASYASAVLQYEANPEFCPGAQVSPAALPLGGRLDYGLGFGHLTGTRRLTSVTTWRDADGDPSPPASGQPAWALIRSYQLNYDTSTECATSGTAAPFRQLSSVQETAVSPNVPMGEAGYQTVKPPVEFTYGKASAYTKLSDYGPEQSLVLPSPDGWYAEYGPMPRTKSGSAAYLWVDINGDGLIDILEDDPITDPGAGGHEVNCMVNVYLNQGDGTFEKNANEFPEFFVEFANADVPVSATQPGFCDMTKSAWSDGNQTSAYRIYRDFFDADLDGLPDMVAQPVFIYGCYDSTFNIPCPAKGVFPWEDENWDEGHYFTDKDDEHTGGIGVQKRWYVYRNTGHGFASQPTLMNPHSEGVKIQGPQYHFGISGTSAEWDNSPIVRQDIDGDGKPDYLGQVGSNDNVLMRGKKEGDYESPGTLWDLGTSLFNSSAATDYDDNGFNYAQKAAIFDVNGDGLPDQVFRNENASPDELQVYLSRGDRFGLEASKPDFDLADGFSPKAEVPWKGHSSSAVNNPFQYMGDSARRHDVLRGMTDMDYDGVGDLVGIDTVGHAGFVLLGGGAGWLAERAVDAVVAPFHLGSSMGIDGKLVQVAHKYPIDLNGDGLRDLVGDADEDGVPEVRFAKPVLDQSADRAAPARLLRTIANGYGAKTTVSYERDTMAGRWVTSEVRTNPGHGEASSTVRYSYLDPQRTADAYGNMAVRGYREAVALKNVGAGTGRLSTVSTTYVYDLDYRGLANRTVTALGAEAFPGGFDPMVETNVVSVSSPAYTSFTLPSVTRSPGMSSGFPMRVVHSSGGSAYTCAGVQGEPLSSCQTAAKRVLTATTFQSEFDGSRFALHVPKTSSTSFINGEGVTETRRTTIQYYRLTFTPSVYRLATYDTVGERVTPSGTEQTGALHIRYVDDAANGGTYKFLRSSSVEDGTGRELTSFVQAFQSGAATGQVHKTWQPEQYGSTGTAAPHSTITYDGFGLYPVRSVNEAGHVTETEVDLGTGAVLATRGPNFTCADGSPSGCAFDTAAKVEATAVSVDGFGRPLTTTISPVGGGSNQVVATASYDDGASYNSGGSTPASAITHALGGDGQMSETLSEYDGLGRVVRTLTQQDPHPQKETLYDYDITGGLKAITTPASTGTGTVAYRFERDGLDRAVKLYGPRADSGAQALLSQNVYNGFTTTTTEMVADVLDQSEKILRTDPAGRLVEVSERTDADTYAATSYTYDKNGNIATITDPDDVVTSMTHDWVGNRTTVTSSGKQWAYGYDRNGNLTSVTEPHPVGQATAYTRTITYDDLNRPLTETPAVRDLTPGEQTAFKTGVSRRFYDTAHPSLSGADAQQQIGRLAYTTSPAATTINRYGPLGNLAGTSQTLTETGGIPSTAETQHQSLTVAAAGMVEASVFTTSGGHTGNTLTYAYDQAGQPLSLRTRIAGSPLLTVAELTRNAVGQITRRQANPGGVAGYAGQTANRTYTPTGQPDDFSLTVGTTSVYTIDNSYNGGGRLLSTYEQLINNAATTFTYNYDARHQLTSARQTAVQPGGGVDYIAAFTYTDGGRLASANIGNTAPAVRMNPRNVSYMYDPANPQRLTQLTKPDATPYTTYNYDDAGNTTKRTTPDGDTITQRWDGYGRLARTTREDGAAETYFYDGAGPNRIAVLQTDAKGNSLEVRRTFGALESVYTPTTDPSYRESLALDGTVGRIDGDVTNANLEYYYTSPQGHEILAINATDGRVMRATTYGPFGEVLTQQLDPGTPEGKYTHEFNGKEFDTHSGLHYYGHRYYDSVALQWISSDPKYRFLPEADLINPRSANLYSYTENNPVEYADPNGLDSGWGALFEGMGNAVGASQGVGVNRQVRDEFAKGMARVAVEGYTRGVVSLIPIVGDVYSIRSAQTTQEKAMAVGCLVLSAVGVVDDVIRGARNVDNAVGAARLGNSHVDDLDPGEWGDLPTRPGAPDRGPGPSERLSSRYNDLHAPVNDEFSSAPNNCVRCSVAGAETLAGNPSTASQFNPTLPQSASVAELNAHFGQTAASFTDGRALLANLAARGEGATGVLGVVRTGGKVGHAITWRVKNGKVQFYDFQISRPGRLHTGNSRGSHEFYVWQRPSAN